MSKGIANVFRLGVAIALFQIPVFAQEPSLGGITGRVSDPTGAANYFGHIAVRDYLLQLAK